MKSASFKAAHPLKPDILPYNHEKAQALLGDAGKIALQIHSGKNGSLLNGHVRYRNIRIRSLIQDQK